MMRPVGGKAQKRKERAKKQRERKDKAHAYMCMRWRAPRLPTTISKAYRTGPTAAGLSFFFLLFVSFSSNPGQLWDAMERGVA